MSTYSWTHVGPEGVSQVTLQFVDGMLDLTKNGVPVPINSREGQGMLAELAGIMADGPA